MYNACNVVNDLLELLGSCRFSNECFDHIRTKIHNQFDELNQTDEADDELDIGRPVISYEKRSPQSILTELLRVISEILDSSDYIAKENLLREGLVEKLLRLRQRFCFKNFQTLKLGKPQWVRGNRAGKF